jgi:hypothetical protein
LEWQERDRASLLNLVDWIDHNFASQQKKQQSAPKGGLLEHCAQKWIPVLRKNNATTQNPRAFLRFRVKAKTP